MANIIEHPMMAMMKGASIRDINKMMEGAFDPRLLFLLDKELIEIKK